MTLAELIAFFDARILKTYTKEEWQVVLQQIRANRGRYGIGQW